MAVNGFTFWRTYWDVAQDLTPNQQGALYRAICEYMFADNDMEGELRGRVLYAFKALKPNIKTSKIRSAAGAKGGKQNASKTEAKKKQDKVQVQDKDKDKGQCEIANSAIAGIPESARSALIDLGMLRGESHAE